MFKYLSFSHFFSKVQETHWYREFLTPVLDEISFGASVLDIGTGSGKLLGLLRKLKEVHATGIDTNQNMLDEAMLKVGSLGVALQKVEPGEKFPFKKNSFEYISLCNVLFNLSSEDALFLISEALRVKTKEGKLIVLTPTGKENSQRSKKGSRPFETISFVIWFQATRKRAIQWSTSKLLIDFCKQNNLSYKSRIVFNGFAKLEIIE